MPSIRKINSRIVDEAHRLVSICKHLDFAAITRHEPLAVAQLQQAVQLLGIKVIRDMGSSRRGGDDVTAPAGAVRSAAAAPAAREAAIEAMLIESGFAERLGRVYNSESKQRMVEFQTVAQRSGLPAFLFVIAPDFAPVAGYHGIFVTASDVYAAVFPVNGNGMWQIDARRSYADMSQMAEWVTLLSAGFALP